jgi:uncharacterized protein (DUF302 family)
MVEEGTRLMDVHDRLGSRAPLVVIITVAEI